MSAPQQQPPYPLIDGFRRTPEKEKEINQLVGHALGDNAGEALLDYLKSITVNVVMGLKGAAYPVAELERAGVRRISVGGAFARASFAAFVDAAREVKEKGTFAFAAHAIPHADLRKYMRSAKR